MENTKLLTYRCNYVSRNETNVLKGIAIVFMLMHHLLTFPEWYIDYSYKYMNGISAIFQDPLKICVGIFAFLTGYFYCFSKDKTIRYSLKKCSDLWLNYFLTFMIMMLFAIIVGTYSFDLSDFLLEAIGLKYTIMSFCWYVPFYIISMLLMPLYEKIANKHILLSIIVGVIIPVCIINVYNKFIYIDNQYINNVVNYMDWYPVISSGYIFARYDLFNQIFDKLFKNNINNKTLFLFINIFILFFGTMGRFILKGLNLNFEVFSLYVRMDILYAPLVVYSIVNLSKLIYHKKLLLPLSILGKYSLNIWFVHAIFFNCCKTITQPILIIVKNPILVVVWGVIISLLISIVISYPINKIIKLKNKLLF